MSERDNSTTAPVHHVLPPAVTGQLEIGPDVTAADLGVNAEQADEKITGLTITAAEARVLLHGMPDYDFSAALTRIANWLAEYDEMPTPAGSQIRTAECDGEDAVPVTGQLTVGTASTAEHVIGGDTLPKIDRERAAKAAVAANNAFGQWMPERWLHLFMDYYEGKR